MPQRTPRPDHPHVSDVVARRDALKGTWEALGREIQRLDVEIEISARGTDASGLSDAALVDLFAATGGTPGAFIEIRRRAPLIQGFNPVPGTSTGHDVISPRFEQQLVAEDARAIAEALVEFKRRFGDPARTMRVVLADPEGDPERDANVLIRHVDASTRIVESRLRDALPRRNTARSRH